MNSNRMTKDELRHDAFVDTTARVTSYLQNNFMTVLVAVAAVAVVVVGVVFLQQSQQRSKMQASQLVFKASSLYTSGQYSDGLQLMDELIAEHSGSREGKQALYLAGASHLALGENENAVRRFEEYLGTDRDGQYATNARLGIALAQEGSGDFTAAAASFSSLREGLAATNPLFQQAALGEARALQELGRIDDAIAAIESLGEVDDFAARAEIDNRLATLEALR